MDFLGKNMKFKPIYFYAGLIIIVIAYLIISTGNNRNSVVSNNIQDQEMPQDDIHKGMTPPGQSSPNKGNVSASVLKKLEILKEDYEKNPLDTAKIKAYADFLLSAHQTENAIPLYKKLLKIHPRDNDSHFVLASIYYNKHDLISAEKEMNLILAYDKSNPQAQYNKGAITAGKGNKLAAEKIWRNVVNKYPGTDAAKLAQNALDKIK